LPGELLAAAAVFAVGFASWRAGLLGGGDVKLLTALAFWVGGSLVVQLVLLTALAGGALAVASLAFRSFGAFVPPVAATILERVGLPVGRGASATLPYGVAIGVSGGWLVHRLFWI
jgi:prepilin peptidase CpaA